MSQQLFSADQVAEQLGLHVRTVRKYIRYGWLKAVRIGKSYRIAAEDLEAFTGHAISLPESGEEVRRSRHVEVASIVEIDAVDPKLAMRISNGLVATGQGRERGETDLRVDCVYNEERAHLKIIVRGGLTASSQLLSLIQLYMD